MSTNLYENGSEWRKWDLHVHTPIDYEWINRPDLSSIDKKKEFAQQYIEFAKFENISLLGITDHNFCDTLDNLVLPFIQEEAKENNITILPGFEITTKDGSGIHVLLLFPEETELQIIKSIVDQCFPPNTNLLPLNRQIPISSKSIDEIKKILDDANQDAIFIYAHADRENGVLDPQTIQGARRVQEWEKDYVHIAQLSKPPNEYNEETFMYNVINLLDRNYARPMTYIVASDCRMIEKENDPVEGRYYLGQKFIWVKADPTFEGLKQIIYEPNERVKIQSSNPTFDYDKPYFKKISIDEDIEIFEDITTPSEQVVFIKNIIPLNKNLITIIGGRGTGKSLLINYFANVFGKHEKNLENSEFSINNNFSVEYAKNNLIDSDIENYLGDEDNVLDFLFISQNKLKSISDKKQIGREIKSLLKLDSLQFDQRINEKIKAIQKAIKDISDWFDEKDEDGDEFHNMAFVQSFKDKNAKLLKSITTEKNKEKLEKYTKNIENIGNIERYILSHNDLKERLSNIEMDINSEIEEINNGLENSYQIPEVSFEPQIKKLDSNIISFQSDMKNKESENTRIKNEFEEEGFLGDLSTLLKSASDYQGNVQWANEQLKEIEKQEQRLNSLIIERNNLGEDIRDEYQRQVDIINESWANIFNNIDNDKHRTLIKHILEDRDICIAGEIKFDSDVFYKKLNEYLNLLFFKSKKKIREAIDIKDIDSFSYFIEHSLSNFVDGIEKEKTKKNIDDLFFDLQERKAYLYSEPKITYRGKSLDKLSVGQRGTVYLCLKLATGAFSKPIIFDQPEDDLDNKFIVDDLINIFRELKKYRQLIIVTHNANLVVNSDSEQVIVASNEDERLKYFSGSLENPTIIKSVCDILEGGMVAFEQRRNKYNI